MFWHLGSYSLSDTKYTLKVNVNNNDNWLIVLVLNLGSEAMIQRLQPKQEKDPLLWWLSLWCQLEQSRQKLMEGKGTVYKACLVSCLLESDLQLGTAELLKEEVLWENDSAPPFSLISSFLKRTQSGPNFLIFFPISANINANTSILTRGVTMGGCKQYVQSDGGHNTGERKTQTQATSHLHFIPWGAACCKEARLAAGQGKGDTWGRGVLLQQAWAFLLSALCSAGKSSLHLDLLLTLCISIRPEIQFAGWHSYFIFHMTQNTVNEREFWRCQGALKRCVNCKDHSCEDRHKCR